MTVTATQFTYAPEFRTIKAICPDKEFHYFYTHLIDENTAIDALGEFFIKAQLDGIVDEQIRKDLCDGCIPYVAFDDEYHLVSISFFPDTKDLSLIINLPDFITEVDDNEDGSIQARLEVSTEDVTDILIASGYSSIKSESYPHDFVLPIIKAIGLLVYDYYQTQAPAEKTISNMPLIPDEVLPTIQLKQKIC
jgi:hypothetical protein